MLTRSAQDQDFAPDVSVYPRERDEDGRRKLDELSFEIVGEQPMSSATRKASVLSAGCACCLLQPSWTRQMPMTRSLMRCGRSGMRR